MLIFVGDVLLYSDEELYIRMKQDVLLIDTATIERVIQGDIYPCYLIGESYIDIKDYLKSMPWFVIGAHQQHPRCLFMMGYLHERSLCSKKKLEKAT